MERVPSEMLAVLSQWRMSSLIDDEIKRSFTPRSFLIAVATVGVLNKAQC